MRVEGYLESMMVSQRREPTAPTDVVGQFPAQVIIETSSYQSGEEVSSQYGELLRARQPEQGSPGFIRRVRGAEQRPTSRPDTAQRLSVAARPASSVKSSGNLEAAAQARIAHLLVERVDVGTYGIAIRLRTAGLAGVIDDSAPRGQKRGRPPDVLG
jgi:hypothetical protein